MKKMLRSLPVGISFPGLYEDKTAYAYNPHPPQTRREAVQLKRQRTEGRLRSHSEQAGV
jgi:hypothetical protein